MRRIRLQLHPVPPTGPLMDRLTLLPAAVWALDDVSVEVFLLDPEEDNTDYADLADIQTLTLRIRTSADAGTALVDTPSDAAPAACTLSAWQDGTGSHAAFTIDGADLDPAATVSTLWLTVRALMDDGTHVTFGAGEIRVHHSGHGSD